MPNNEKKDVQQDALTPAIILAELRLQELHKI